MDAPADRPSGQPSSQPSSDEVLELHDLLLGAVGHALIATRPDGTVIYWNQAATDLYGWTAQEALGRDVLELTPSHASAAQGAAIAASLAAGEPWSGEFEVRDRHGRTFPALVTDTPVLDADGQLVAIIGVSADLSERTRHERRLEALSAIVASSGDAIIGCDLDGVITSWNDMATQVYGYTSEEAIGSPLTMLCTPAAAGEPAELVAQLRRTGQPARRVSRRRRRTGQEVEMSTTVSPVLDDAGLLVGFSSTERDVTDAVAAQRQARDDQRRLETSQRLAGLGSFEWDLATDRWRWSPEMFRILGLPPRSGPPTEAEAQVLMGGTDLGTLQAWSRRSVAGAARNEGNLRFRHPTLGLRWARVRREIERDDLGRPVRMSGTIDDVTEQLRLEAELRQSQKMESIGRFAGGIAHDFNNLLTVILGYGELAQAELAHLPGAAAVAEHVRLAVVAAEQAARLTQRLLLFARPTAGGMEVVDAAGAIDEFRLLLERMIGDDVALQLVLHPGVPAVALQAGQLEVIVMNLAVNARDAMPSGGQLRIEVGSEELDEPDGPVPAGAWTVITVADDGVGMEPDVLAASMEPFFTTKDPQHGTGLGLSTVYATITRAGGVVRVESEPEVGTTVRLYLPSITEVVSSMGPPLRRVGPGTPSS